MKEIQCTYLFSVFNRHIQIMLHKLRFKTIEELFKKDKDPDATVVYTQAYFDFQYYCSHLMYTLSEGKETSSGTSYNKSEIKKQIKGILKCVCIMLHLLDMETPEEDDIDKFIAESVPPEVEEDAILSLCNLQIGFLSNYSAYFLGKGGSTPSGEEFQESVISNRDVVLSSCWLILENTDIDVEDVFELDD